MTLPGGDCGAQIAQSTESAAMRKVANHGYRRSQLDAVKADIGGWQYYFYRVQPHSPQLQIDDGGRFRDAGEALDAAREAVDMLLGRMAHRV
jgi:hypothetical protein